MKLAIFSPSDNAYSESFVQAHKSLADDSLFYYGGLVPQFLEGKGALIGEKRIISNLKLRLFFFLLSHPSILAYPHTFSLNERILAHSLKKNKVTHVLAEFGNCAASVVGVCKYSDIKLIAHFHGYEISRYTIIDQFRESYIELFKYAEKIIVVSILMRDKVISMGCNPDKIVYSPCGPNDSMLECNPEFTSNNVLFVGRFVEKKAPIDAIKALSIIHKMYPDCTMTMIGDGPLMEPCRKMSEQLGLNGNIFFCGPVEHRIIHSFFEKASVYIQPSVTADDGDQEGTPVSVMEANLAGLPVVSTIHAGIPDVIINGENGYLVKEHDVESLAQRICLLLSDKSLARKMGEIGRKKVKENYLLSLSLDRIRSILN